MKKIGPDEKRNDCQSNAAEADAPVLDDRIDRPPPSEAMIEFVKALARAREKIDYEEAKAAWLTKQRPDR